ncbi:hypothetical protein WICMUC_001121 [Wickerhamomyces mucosus]|uniref:Uncharacterized protein n=1 Tax=Wickerhamomyces mucosus TaxID=1378264 RepID=A0A9P8PW78_9ASCO|nr:hypothetical protein WICMUC_001121 [Wickerhamomyces mucosus]
MSKRSQDPKRQLFKSLNSTSNTQSSLDQSTTNLLSETLRKQSDKYRRQEPETTEFVIHKSTSPENYKIFSSHPLRESKLQALETSEQTLENLFHPNQQRQDRHHHQHQYHNPNTSYTGNNNSTYYELSSEDEDSELPDISSLPQHDFHNNEDDILISIPGYSKEEIVALKNLNSKDRKNLRIPKKSSLEQAFSSVSSLKYLRSLNREKLQEYAALNNEFEDEMEQIRRQKMKKLQLQHKIFTQKRIDPSEIEDFQLEPYQAETLRDAVSQLDETSWMYSKSFIRP